MLVVSAIVGILSAMLLINFRSISSSKNVVERNAFLVVSQIREAQTLSVTTTSYNEEIACGYGIRYNSTPGFGTISIYFTPKPVATDCDAENKNYESGKDTMIKTLSFPDKNIVVKQAFKDIFFVPPDPKTYIDDSFSYGSFEEIIVGSKDKDCAIAPGCKTVKVYSSGQIDVADSP